MLGDCTNAFGVGKMDYLYGRRSSASSGNQCSESQRRQRLDRRPADRVAKAHPGVIQVVVAAKRVPEKEGGIDGGVTAFVRSISKRFKQIPEIARAQTTWIGGVCGVVARVGVQVLSTRFTCRVT